MDAVTASPTKIVDLVKKGAAFLKDAAMASQGKPPVRNKSDVGGRRKEEEQQGGDSESSTGEGLADLASGAGGGK